MQTAQTKIGLYKTSESGSPIFKHSLEKLIKANGLDISVLNLSSREIQKGALYREDIIGLVLPGRTRGQDYREELGDAGNMVIQRATERAGLSVLAVCAG